MALFTFNLDLFSPWTAEEYYTSTSGGAGDIRCSKSLRSVQFATSDIYLVWWTIIEHLKGCMYLTGLKQCLHVSPLRLLGQSWSWLVEHWAVGGGGGGVVAQFHRRVSRSQPPPPRLPVPHIGDHHPISCWINFTHYQSVFSQTQPTR